MSCAREIASPQPGGYGGFNVTSLVIPLKPSVYQLCSIVPSLFSSAPIRMNA
jgi:hypothetical protein